MSDSDNAYKGSTFWQLIIAIPGSILAFTLLIALIAKTSNSIGVPAVAEPEAVVAKAAENNIKPVAVAEVAAVEAGPHADKSGEEVYKSVCMMCHAAGLMAAPKFGDKEGWKPRIAQGYETLVTHAIKGIRNMPAKGGNPALTDGEIYNAVAHMANSAGANFKAPDVKEAADKTPTDKAVAPAAPVEAKTDTAKTDTAKTDTVKAAEKIKETDKVPASKAAEKEAAAIAPIAEVQEKSTAVVAQNTEAAGKSGEEVYKSVCMMCHAAGLMAAPKFGDNAQWEPRIAQGYDTLVSHAVKGIRNMPAKGGNLALSDAEVAGAVKYMANASGAKF